ncbi:YchE family NAAT transporter [Buchnera aphidicola]|uniref:YchE family NAAT transporter n=1 Tax=Buchnera aphidicola TaxID=9 RepID=UPI0034644A42
MHFDYLNYLKFFVNLFVLVNPIGLIPVFISITNSFSHIERENINFIANFSACIILCLSLILGKIILNFFGVSIAAFRISGGILICFISISMINNKKLIKENKIQEKKNVSDISVIPLAIPLIAGPGTISSTILWGTQNTNFLNTFLCIITIIIFFCLCYFIFRLSPFFIKILGNIGINVITKITGILLLSLGVEFILSGMELIV